MTGKYELLICVMRSVDFSNTFWYFTTDTAGAGTQR